MAEMACGRSAMCGECVDIHPHSRQDVCLAVAHVLQLPHPEDLTYVALEQITLRHMRWTADDEDVISVEMREAAAESAYELITK
jgi:hypothetical protein